MSEEQQIIEWLKNTSLDELVQNIFGYMHKLEEENEELKRKTYKAYINGIGEVELVFDNYISKDKIRAKIKELEKEMNREDIQEEHFWCVEAERSVLVELLGE